MKKVLALIMVLSMAVVCCACGEVERDPSGISQEEFQKIYTGMSISTVEEIVGGEGEIVSEKDNSTDEYYEKVLVYKFKGELSGYAEMEFTYHKDKGAIMNSKTGELTSKEQYDLS